MKLISELEKLLLRRGYAITWLPEKILSYENRIDDIFYFCACHLTLVKKDVFFVEIGANDGRTNDPIFPLVQKFNWKGIAVEPLPNVFENLKKAYSDIEGIQCLNVAVGRSTGTSKFYAVSDVASDGPGYKSHQLSSFDKSHVLKHISRLPEGENKITEIEVPTLSWEDLCKLANGRSVDAVQIDVEGFDAEIVKMIDLSSSGPSLIQFEHAHLSKRDQNECVDRLVDNGYRIGRSRGDTVAYRY